MRLTPEQENAIEEFVDQHDWKIPTLRDDLIDHLCCVVESGLGKGKSFEQTLYRAVKEIAPDGFKSIEQKTIFLLNYKRIIIMKKAMYIIGFIGALSLTAGIIFKLLHFPAGNELFMVGFLTILLVFVPLLAIDRYKVSISKTISHKLKFILGTMAAVITGLSGLFKILHWQGATTLLMLGGLIFAVGFLPFLFFTMYKKSISKA